MSLSTNTQVYTMYNVECVYNRSMLHNEPITLQVSVLHNCDCTCTSLFEHAKPHEMPHTCSVFSIFYCYTRPTCKTTSKSALTT